MKRRLFLAGLTTTVALGAAIDLEACGDKFLRVGRSARFRRYAAAYPASILIYPPPNSTRKGIDELKDILKRAGHKPTVVERRASVAAALSTSPYDVVLGDYQEADRLTADLQAATSHAALLPILNQAGKAAQTEAARRYAFVIVPHAMTSYDALAEIDRLMESKSRGTAATTGTAASK